MHRFLPKKFREKYCGIKFVLLLIAILAFNSNSNAQCPPNIDFELRSFNNWECWSGHVFDRGGKNSIEWDPPGLPVPPDPARHIMLSRIPGDGLDPYGLFPKNCPNGSNNSIQLGNSGGGHEAEGVSYTFTIPLGQNEFSLIYNYAVVFQDPGHNDWEQPRLEIEIFNVTDNDTIPCSNFNFIATSSLPGFFVSPVDPTVLCKNWSANSINLNGLAGKTIRLFFKTADCVFQVHFGYAYIDVNTQCGSSFNGATFCPDDTAINIVAPFGYQAYKWFDINNTVLGTTQNLYMNPPPLSGDSVFVELTPYAGYGCLDTLTAHLWDTLTVISNAGPDQLSCQNAPVQLGIPPTPGWVYSWDPITDLSDPNISNPIATPSVTTTYVLSVKNSGGGCLTMDTVEVKAAVLDNALSVTGIKTYCLDDPQGAIMEVPPADSIQWYLNGLPIPGANQTTYRATQTGTYRATVFSFTGCFLNTVDELITVYAEPVAGFSLNASQTLEQCFNGHQFDFTNTSSISAGTITYSWDLGDGTTSTAADISHTYAQPGLYLVKLVVTSDNGCVDSTEVMVKVKVSPASSFDNTPDDQCFLNNEFVFTSTSTVAVGGLLHRWNMGDGNFKSSNDVIYSYANPGTYTVRLLVFSDEGCVDSSDFDVIVNPMPVAGFSASNPQQCLGNNQFDFTNTSTIQWGNMNYLWDFGDGTTATTRDASHQFTTVGNHVVKMLVTSDFGCADSSFTTINIYNRPFSGFLISQPTCVGLPLNLVNTTQNNTTSTINYLWDFGNGQTSTFKNPVHSYPAAGTYVVKLSVSTAQCPTTFTTQQQAVVIDEKLPGIVYPEKTAIYNFPLDLAARNIGNGVTWTPATNLNNRFSYTPTFRGLTTQLYTIELKTPSGCITVDTQLVTAIKKIKIYVPTAFTPGKRDGLNDLLRPLLYGFVKVNYFRIYNRWGKMLFQMQSDRPGWDGRLNGQLLDNATYVWMIEAVDVDGKVHREQGTTVLLH